MGSVLQDPRSKVQFINAHTEQMTLQPGLRRPSILRIPDTAKERA
ncbi:hypothetical protein MICRO8M_60292 [Microbacterium sp. 8M]|nr:hypothetical protein MICRO8M_60292 [Microbacterium sp. 8M]